MTVSHVLRGFSQYQRRSPGDTMIKPQRFLQILCTSETFQSCYNSAHKVSKMERKKYKEASHSKGFIMPRRCTAQEFEP